MLKPFLILIAAILLTGCATAIHPSAAKQIPAERVFLKPSADDAHGVIVVTRDAGTGLCLFDLKLDGRLAATFEPEESATFRVTPGEINLSAWYSEASRGICSIAKSSADPAAIETIVRPGETKHFRITVEFNGPAIKRSIK